MQQIDSLSTENQAFLGLIKVL